MPTRAPTLWVHRLSVDASGSPASDVRLAEVESDLFEVAKAIMTGPREQLDDRPEEARAFLVGELFERGVLRQGWGAPGMSATRRTTFLKNFVIAMWRYWDGIPLSVRDELKEQKGGNYSRLFEILEPSYRQAAGRFAIIIRMVEMRYGDVVFVPNVPAKVTTFTVARIDDREYEFDDDRQIDSATTVWQVDYRHRRRVRDVRRFEYGTDTLERGVFGTPYRHAIDRVSAREDQLRRFLELRYA